MVAVAYVAPSPKALRDPNLKDRVIISEADASHPRTPERPDGGEIFIAANEDQMPTLVALTEEVQKHIATGELVQMDEGDAINRRREIVSQKVDARQRFLNLAAQDRPLSDAEARDQIKAMSDVQTPEGADLQDAPTQANQRANVTATNDRVNAAASPEELDAIAAEEAGYPGGPRKGVTAAIDARRQQLAAGQ